MTLLEVLECGELGVGHFPRKCSPTNVFPTVGGTADVSPSWFL